MRCVKYLITALCIFIMLLMTTELLEMQSSDFSSFVYFEVHDMSLDLAERRLDVITNLLNKNELEYFAVFERTSGNSVFLDLFFSSSEALKEYDEYWGREQGYYPGYFSKDTYITFHDNIKDIASFSWIPENFNIYILNVSMEEIAYLPYQTNYLLSIAKHQSPTLPYATIVSLLWLGNAVFFVLLSVIYVYYNKREWFISVTYGYRIGKIVSLELLRELFISSGLIFLAFLIYRRGLISIIDVPVMQYVFFVALANALVIVSPVLFVDFRRIIGKGKNDSNVLIMCYVNRVVLIMISVLLCAGAVGRFDIYYKCKKYDDMMSRYREYNCVNIPSAFENRLIMERIATVTIEKDIYCDVILVNHNAKDFISDIMIDNIESDNILVLYPKDVPNLPIEDEKRFVTLVSDEEYCVKHYDKDVSIEFLSIGTEGMESTLLSNVFTIEKATSPIVIYIPQNKNTLYTNTVSFVKKGQITNGIMFDIYEEYLSLTYKYRNQFYVLTILAISFLIFCFFIEQIILKTEHSVNAMEICLMRINGASVWERYDGFFAGSFFSYMIGITISCVLMKLLGGTVAEAVLTGSVLLGIDVVVVVKRIMYWEKTHVVSVLKGGAL